MSLLDEKTREYYRTVWGFDPLKDRHIVKEPVPDIHGICVEERGKFYYERDFLLEEDEVLKKT